MTTNGRPHMSKASLSLALILLMGCTTHGNELVGFAGPDERPGLRAGGLEHIEPAYSELMDGFLPSAAMWSTEGWLNQQVTELPAAQTTTTFTMHALSSIEVPKATLNQEAKPVAIIQLGINSKTVLMRGDDGSPSADIGRTGLVLIVDRSGSMEGQGRLKRLQEGLRLLVDALPDGIVLAMVTFNRESFLTIAPMTYKEASHRVELYGLIDGITAAGGTNIAEGLRRGLSITAQLGDDVVNRHILLMTDGKPTAGETDHNRIANLIDSHSPATSLSTLGIGDAFSPSLLKRLATRGHGCHWFVRSAAASRDVPNEWMQSLPVPRVRDLKIRIDPVAPWQVEDIPGFLLKRHDDGHIDLVGPTQRLAAGDSPMPVASAGKKSIAEPSASMPEHLVTLRHGLVLVRMKRTTPWTGKAMVGQEMAQVSWQLELADEQQTQTGSVTAKVAQVIADGAGGSTAHASPISERSLGLLRIGVSVDKALKDWAKAVELSAANAPATEVGAHVSAAINEAEAALARVQAQIDAIGADENETPQSLSYAKTLLTRTLEVMKAGEL